MTVTSIQAQKNRQDRYSIFVDGKYMLSMSGRALLESGLVRGQEISPAELKKLQEMTADDVVYERALKYASLRLRSAWEVSQYLRRRKVSPALSEIILNKLSDISLIDDRQFAAAFVRDRQRLRPSSRRKILYELKNKHIADEIIEKVLVDTGEVDDSTALRSVIEKKRKESRYQDDLKLMQYLSRQGFSYGDIKTALEDS